VKVKFEDGTSTIANMRWRRNIDDWSTCRDIPDAIKLRRYKPLDPVCHYLLEFEIPEKQIESVELQTKQSVYPSGPMTVHYRAIIFEK
jgi:hypothetical protein